MNCAEFAIVVHELAAEDSRADKKTLSAAEAISARFHAEICAVCAARLHEAQSVAMALNFAAEQAAKTGVRAQVEMTVLEAFREHQRTTKPVQYEPRRSPVRWTEWIAVSAAAAVLLAVGAWKFSRTHSPKVSRTSIASPADDANAGTEPAADSRDTAVQDSDFVPLPYGEDFSADDSGVVVRVSMTRDALESLGYPVDEVRGQDVVQADLVVGEDGWPRAVRLVQ